MVKLITAIIFQYQWVISASSSCSTVPCRLCSGAAALVFGGTCGIVHTSTPWLLTVTAKQLSAGGGLLVVLMRQMYCSKC